MDIRKSSSRSLVFVMLGTGELMISCSFGKSSIAGRPLNSTQV